MLRAPNSRYESRPGTRRGVESEEVRLVGRVAAGDMSAFDELYRGYHPRLTRFLERMTRRSDLVEEVLNDTMLVVWNHADRFNATSKVSTWIFAIAYRKALKMLQRLDEPVDDSAAEQVAALGPEPDEEFARMQLRRALLGALDGLSAVQRAVVDLTYFQGFGYSEIARIVECPVDTVKTRMFHARRRLRALLEGRVENWL